MAEPALDLSEIIDLYKDDARGMIVQMNAAMAKWTDIQAGGTARLELRKLSHQLRGSGRTYGFRDVSRIGKAIEKIVMRLESQRLQADDRVRLSLQKKIALLERVFHA